MNQIKQEPPPGPKRNFDIEKNSSKLKEKGEASSKENNDSRIEEKMKIPIPALTAAQLTPRGTYQLYRLPLSRQNSRTKC